jgi:hypothetical protein
LNGKQNIRYTGFECTKDGGRRYDFNVACPEQPTVRYSVEVAGLNFSGPDRILVQEGAGICFLKVKEMCEGITALDTHISLSSTDIVQFRQALPIQGRKKNPAAADVE